MSSTLVEGSPGDPGLAKLQFPILAAEDYMLSYYLTEDVQQLIDAFQGGEDFIEGVGKLAAWEGRMDEHLSGIAKGGQKLQEHSNALHSFLANAGQALEGMPMIPFVRSMDRLVDGLRQYLNTNAADADDLFNLVRDIEQFSQILDTFVRAQTASNAVPVLRVSKQLDSTLSAYAGFLIHMHTRLEDHPPIHEGEDTLVLHFLDEVSLVDMAMKLNAIDQLCDIACQVVYPNLPRNEVVRVLKIESGSFLTWLAGKAAVIGLITQQIKAAVEFFYRNYTTEGKLKHGVPTQAAALEELIKIRVKLAKLGLDTEQIDQGLVHNAEAIAHNLHTLIEGRERVRINGTEYIGGDDFSIPRLPVMKPLRLQKPETPPQEDKP